MPNTSPPRKRPIILIVIVALVAIVAGVLIASRLYADTVSSEAADAPTLSSSAATAPATSADGTWTSTDGSYAGYRLEEVLNGSDVTVTGRTEDVDATFNVSDKELTDATATIQVSSITTDSDRRDNYFRSTAIDTTANPEATFTLTAPVDISSALDDGSGTVTLQGDLRINGQTQPITVEADSVFGGGTAQIVGQIPVTWADFGVEAPNLGFVSVEDTGFIEFSLTMVKD